jgi:putative membrane-bound dehydrogenase-like protein
MQKTFWVGLVWMTLSLTTVGQEIELENTQKLTSPLPSPIESLEMIQLPEGFQATLFAAEPDIRQPISITTDTRGRIWMAECLTYAESKKNFDTRYDDRVLIFEDTDQDGVADQHKVFWSGGKRLTSVEVGMGGVWVTCAPNLMFIPDRDGDDIPDGPAEIVLDGFNDGFVRHNLVNGLKFGPDGWLYGRHGIQATSHVGPPGSTDSQRTSLNCCIWRFHPVTREFDVVCEGTTNPWGHDWDQHGELFMINTVIGHLWHVVPGARFRRMYGSHFNPYTYEPIEQCADHFHFSGKESWSDVKKLGITEETSSLGGGHAHCGFMIYQGDNWPGEYRGDSFTANFHGRRLNRDSFAREKNGYVAHHEKDFMFTKDLWFRGVELIYGPDGGVYLLDWSDIGECHENDGIHRTTGRVFKFKHTGNHSDTFQPDSKATNFDLSGLSNEALLAKLSHKNRWFPRTVRKELQARALNKETQEKLNQLLRNKLTQVINSNSTSNEDDRVNGILQTLWTLATIHPDQSKLNLPLELLNDQNEHVRVWAIRLGLGSLEERLQIAKSDPSGLVRLYLASSLANLNAKDRLSLARVLCEHAEDEEDRTQAKLIWYQIEPVVVERWQEALNLAESTRLTHLRRCVVRRLAAAVDSRPELLEQILTATITSKHQQKFLDSIVESLQGRRTIPTPSNWTEVAQSLSTKNDETINRSLAFLGTLFGEGASLEQLKSIVSDKNNDPSVRREAIRAIANSNADDDMFSFLKGQIRDRSVAIEVVRALSNCDEPQVANVILNAFGTFDVETERAAVGTLCTRKPWASTLLVAIGNERIAKNRFQASHARQIKNLGDEALDELLAKHWGVIKETSADREQQIESVRALVENGDITPDFANGAKLFQVNCASCHVLFGQGGLRGPDLTGSDRKNLSYLLENVIDPSASVADTYRSSVIVTEDGRTLNGVITEETETTFKLLMVESEIVLDKAEVEQRRSTSKSLMPDGLLENLSEQELVDLFGFLRK